MLVSIITVCYNSSSELPATINSILSQSLSNFEYIIIDGASKDSSQQMIENVAYDIQEGLYPSITTDQFKWVSEPDKGLYDAMNKAIKMATGDFVWFINAGDKLYNKNTLQRVYDAYLNNKMCDVLYSQALIIDMQDKIIGERHKRAPYFLKRRSLLNGLVVSHQAIIVKRDIAPLYNLNYAISSDYDWVCRVLEKSKKNVYISGYIALFQTGGLSTQRRSKSWLERFSIMKKHFGLCQTVFAHILIILKYPFTNK